jgi:hypothetical protein
VCLNVWSGDILCACWAFIVVACVLDTGLGININIKNYYPYLDRFSSEREVESRPRFLSDQCSICTRTRTRTRTRTSICSFACIISASWILSFYMFKLMHILPHPSHTPYIRRCPSLEDSIHMHSGTKDLTTSSQCMCPFSTSLSQPCFFSTKTSIWCDPEARPWAASTP